jgi:hypothetical protein
MVSGWKIFVALAVVLPLGAFVAGSLAQADLEQPPREPIIIRDDTATPDDPVTPGSVDPPPTRTPDDRDDDDDRDDHVVTPQPTDDHGRADRDDDGESGDDDDGEGEDDD